MTRTEYRTLGDRCRSIELLISDVDGVLTSGEIIYSDQGDEIKQFHVRDGSALKCWRHAGKLAAILSGRSAKCVERRARELGIDIVIQGRENKLQSYDEVLEKIGVASAQVCVIGDDLADLPLFRHSGLAVAVADACPDVLAQAHFVTQAAGGRGALFEVIRLILMCLGRWQ
jgi:3-deoxy-D-manno-octulosonate 8-phosphate phosphatase (KDO 8-P phosphatase)